MTAGYEATNIQVRRNKAATTASDSFLVESVTFRAIPGRDLWHPFRHALRGDEAHREEDRAAEPPEKGSTEQLLKMMSDKGAILVDWYVRVLGSTMAQRSVWSPDAP